MWVIDIFLIFEKFGLIIDIVVFLLLKDVKVSNEKYYIYENNLYLILEWWNMMRICYEYLLMIELLIYLIES